MIDLSHKFALLEDGKIEPLFYEDGEPRQAYQDQNGKFYLDHDVWFEFGGGMCQAYMHSEIVRTADSTEELVKCRTE